MQKGLGSLSYLVGVKKAVLVSVMELNLKSSMAGDFTVPYRVWSERKKYARRYLTINFTNSRCSKQSSLTLLKIMKVDQLMCCFSIGTS